MVSPSRSSVSSLGCASAPSEAAQAAEQDLIGGASTIGQAKYEAVGALLEGDATEPFCTATLVAPNLIITARHCIEGGSEEDPHPKDPKTVTFRHGASVQAATGGATLKRWLEAPDFDMPDHTLYASDVMLAELEGELDIPFIPISKTPVAKLGESFEVVGFGVRTVDGHGSAEGQREVGTFQLEATSGNALEKRLAPSRVSATSTRSSTRRASSTT